MALDLYWQLIAPCLWLVDGNQLLFFTKIQQAAFIIIIYVEF